MHPHHRSPIAYINNLPPDKAGPEGLVPLKETLRLSIFDYAKRCIDAVVATIALIVLSPLMAVIAALVAKNLGRPVLFRQYRPGKNGEVFELVKFRTMLTADPGKEPATNEKRLTRFGSSLRSTSLDELPSLWNILKGDMSIVGPRPLLVSYLPLYTESQARRHEVRPGLTGLAQVNGRNELEWNKRFEMDVQYVDSRSVRLDFEIILKTVRKVLVRDGISSQGHVVGAPFTGTGTNP